MTCVAPMGFLPVCQVIGRPFFRFIFLSTQDAEPNAAPNRQLRLVNCLGVFGFSFVSLWRSVSLDVRRRAEAIVRGGFEQKETKRTKGPWIFVSFVAFCGFSGSFRSWGRISFRVFRVFRGYIPSAVAGPAA